MRLQITSGSALEKVLLLQLGESKETMAETRMTQSQIVKELAVVRAELEGPRVQGAARLELLRRQANLGDRRDSALDERRKAARPR